MQTKRSARSATIFSRVSAPPPPLIMQPCGSISSAPSMYTGMRSTPLPSSTSMPSARSRGVLCSLLDTAPAMRSLMRAQRIDEMVHRRAGAHAHHRARLHIGQRGAADQGLEFILCHAPIIASARPAAAPECRPMPLIPYALTRPFLFGLDPEAAHDLTLGTLARLQNTPAQCLWQGRAHRRPGDPRRPDASPTASAWPPGWTRTAAASTAWARWASASSRSARSRRRRSRATPSRACSACRRRNALINRLGFNNDGLAGLRRQRAARAQLPQRPAASLGLNIGKNAATPIERAADDYLIGLEGVFPHADYVTVNISSPNTKNLRELQGDAALDALLGALQQRAAAVADRRSRRQVPMFLKIAPDLDEAQVRRHRRHAAAAPHRRRHRHQHHAGARARCRACRMPTRPAGCRARRCCEASNRVIRQLRAALGKRLSDHRRRRRDERRRRAVQDRRRRRPGADLHRADLPGPGIVGEVAAALKRGRA